MGVHTKVLGSNAVSHRADWRRDDVPDLYSVGARFES
jgi:hypothetical protein